MKRIFFLTLSLVFISTNLVYGQSPEPFKENNKWGYKDFKGNVIVAPKYDSAQTFYRDFAIVKLDKKFGFINTKGVEIIPTDFDKVENFTYGYAKVKSDGKWGLIDTKGTIIISLKYDNIIQIYKEKYISIQLNDKWGLIDLKENVLIPIEYDYSLYGSDGIFAASKNDKAGYINIKNQVVIPFDYSVTEDFYSELAIVYKGDSLGMINKANQVIIPIQFGLIDDGYIDYYHYVIAQLPNGKYGIWSDNGQQIVDPVYDNYIDMNDGYLVLINGNRQCLLGPDGSIELVCDNQTITECEFDYTYITFTKNGKMGLYNTVTKKIIIDALYDGYDTFDSDEYLLIGNENKIGLLNITTGKTVIKPEYDEIGATKYGYFQVWKNDRFGLINADGEIILAPIYAELFFVNSKTVATVLNEDEEPIYFMLKGGQAIVKE